MFQAAKAKPVFTGSNLLIQRKKASAGSAPFSTRAHFHPCSDPKRFRISLVCPKSSVQLFNIQKFIIERCTM